MKEQWAKDMQRKLADFEKPAPELSWSEVMKAVEQQRQPAHAKAKSINIWAKRITAAAAVCVLLAGVGIMYFHDETVNTSDVTAQQSSKETPHQQTPQTEKSITEQLVAEIKKTIHTQQKDIILAKANDEIGSVQMISPVSIPATQNSEDNVSETNNTQTDAPKSKEKTPKKRYIESFTEPTTLSTSRNRSTKGIKLGMYAGNTMTSQNSTVGHGMMLANADPFGVADDMFRTETSNIINRTETANKSHVNHHQPIRVGLRARYNINDKWSVESGVTYSYLSSDITTEGHTYTKETEQKLHYIGIPVNLNYNIWSNKRFNIYASAGGMGEKMVKGKASNKNFINGKMESVDNQDIKMNQLQWSVNGAIGAEYNVNKTIGVYLEPGVSYYIKNSSDVKTIYDDKPLNLNINIGVRMNIK